MNPGSTHTRRKSSIPRLLAAIATIGVCSSVALAQPTPPSPTPPSPTAPSPAPMPPPSDEAGAPPAPRHAAPPREAAADPVPLEGTVKSFNFGPGGDFESVMIDVGPGKQTQVNFPPPMSDAITKAVSVGDKLSLTAEPRRSLPDHPVYELATLTGKDGKVLTIPRPGDEKVGHVEGTVTRLNYGRDGRLNGAVIDDATFVHVGPDGVDQLKLAAGQKLTVDGKERGTMSGHAVIDADTVNGAAVPHPQPPKPRPNDRGRDDRRPDDLGPENRADAPAPK